MITRLPKTNLSWHSLAQAQATPASANLIDAITNELSKGSLTIFGTELLKRLRDCVYFATLTFPAALQAKFAPDNGYLIYWIYALDALLDTCPSLAYAEDITRILEQRFSIPFDQELALAELDLATDPTTILPGLEYSMLALAEGIQPLRLSLAQRQCDPYGLAEFDSFLLHGIIPAMTQETRWRLGLDAPPDFNTYMNARWVSISGGLCVRTLNALLPHPRENLAQVSRATELMLRTTGLINDEATVDKDIVEGKPNAVLLLAAGQPLSVGKSRVRDIIDSNAAELFALCNPAIGAKDLTDALDILNYFIFYCWVITEAMYHQGDFVDPARGSVDIWLLPRP